MISTWLANHKAMIAAIAAAAAAASGVLPPPYSQYLMALAIALAALSGGPQPAVSTPTK